MTDTQPRMGRGTWYVLAAAVLWGTTGTAQAFAPLGVESAVVGAIRLVIGGVALLAMAMWRGDFRAGGRWPVMATGGAAISIAAYQLCFFAGVARTGVAIGAMVAIGSAPVLAGLLGLLAGGESGTLNADRGSTITSKCVAHLLADLGMVKTHSRPQVSNDNPFSEAQFKTVKYRQNCPERFGGVEDARAWARELSSGTITSITTPGLGC